MGWHGMLGWDGTGTAGEVLVGIFYCVCTLIVDEWRSLLYSKSLVLFLRQRLARLLASSCI